MVNCFVFPFLLNTQCSENIQQASIVNGYKGGKIRGESDVLAEGTF